MRNTIKKFSVHFAFFLLALLLSSCKPYPPKYATAGEDITTTLNQSIQKDTQLKKASKMSRSHAVKDDLLPPLSLDAPNFATEPPEHRFDVTANNMPAKNFFLGLVAGTHENMMVSDSTAGNITLNLKNVTIEEALNAARDMYGYEYKKTDMGYEILPLKMTTEIFTINYLDINRNGQSQTQLISTDITNANSSTSNNGTSSGSTSGYSPPAASIPINPGNPTTPGSQNNSPTGSGTIVVTKETTDFWSNLKETLKTLIGDKEGRWVIVNPQASVIMVHAYPRELHQVSRYLKKIQGNLQREVVIEAKILEITLADNYQAGVNWKALGAVQNGINGLSPSFADNGQIFSLSINSQNADFNTVINLLAQQGNIQVLSSPRISTINNQEAVIKVGNDQFFVTGYTSNITPTGSTNTTSQSVALNPFFSGITLDVTPQISGSGKVTLYIHPSISKVESQNTTIQLGSTGTTNSTQNNLVLPLAVSTIRESDDVVNALNGQIIVIGGLMQNTNSEVVAGTPGLAKIPVAGALARNTNQIASKTELVILLRAMVVNNKTWGKQLSTAAYNFKRTQRGFHVGGLPEDFGTQGEFPKYVKPRAIDPS
ncbi:MAG: secretin N-terminal domain-containing protein [Gammaproteobacteria bacterium]|nr:secretin N-terminal domain-containing protein [Gammaproteobacteria bacterium]